MADTLIPYSFVPGTKAMADEVNANFIALAQSVEDMKTFTAEAIETFNTEFEAGLDEFDGKIGEKLSPNMSNSVNITNCILELPQRIKVTLSNGIFTLKAGSVVTIPDGFESDGITKKFIYYELKTDMTLSDTSGVASTAFVYCRTDGKLFARGASNTSSSTVSSTFNGANYNPSTNIVTSYSNGTVSVDKCSLPLGIIIITAASGITEIKQIFNSMGYIGNTIWVDKDVTGLVPNGWNADGTYNNILYTTPRVLFNTLTAARTDMSLLVNSSTNTLNWGISYLYDAENNIVVSQNSRIPAFMYAKATSNSAGTITSFTPYGVFTMASKVDLQSKAEKDLSNVALDYSSGVNISSGWTAAKAGVVYCNIMSDTLDGTAVVSINGTPVFTNIQTGSNRNHHEIGVTVFISPGQTLTAEGSIYSLVFYPYK